MAVWAHTTTRTIIGSYNPKVRYRFYARTAFTESSTWQEFKVEPGWALTFTANQGAVLDCNPINLTLSFSDELDTSNRMQLAAEIKVECTVSGVTEIMFLGITNDVDPDDAEFGLTAYDPFARWNTMTVDLWDEATRIALGTGVALTRLSTEYPDQLIYGVSTATTAAFIAGDTDLPRREWAQSGLTLYDSSSDPVPTTMWEPIGESGVIRMLSEEPTGPFTLDGVEVYQEGTFDISDPLKTIISAAKPNGPGGTSAQWTIARTCDTGCSTTVLVLKEGVRHLYPFHNVVVTGAVFTETRRIASRDLAAGTITVSPALSFTPAVNNPVCYDSLNVGIDISKAVWTPGKGSCMDFYKSMLKSANDTVVLQYNANEGVYELLRYQQVSASEYALTDACRVSSNQARSLDGLYTRQVATGSVERPENVLTRSDTTLYIYEPPEGPSGQQTKQYLDGVVTYGGAENTALWTDGNANSAFGWHQGYSWDAYKKVALWTLAATTVIRAGMIVAPPTQNTSAAGSYRNYGYTVEGSLDGTNWYVMSPQLYMRELEPSSRLDVAEGDFSQPEVKYIRVKVKPAKDGQNNLNDPFLGIGEIAFYERVDYEVEAAIQDTDPTGTVTVRVPYGPDWQETKSTYYPNLLKKLGGVHRTAVPLKLDNVLNEVKALELAWLHVWSMIKLYQAVAFTHVCDPYARVGDTVSAEDEINGTVVMMIERVKHSDAETVIEGTDYNSGPPATEGA